MNCAEGLHLRRAGRDREAVTPLSVAVALRPENVDARLRLAGALVNSGRYPEAIEHYRVALTLGADPALTNYALGLASLELGDHGAMVAAHPRGAGLAPGLDGAGLAVPPVCPAVPVDRRGGGRSLGQSIERPEVLKRALLDVYWVEFGLT